jgi:hypothetical protein
MRAGAVMTGRRFGAAQIRRNPASFAWWCAHGIALLALVLSTEARGAWFWIIGAALAVSSYTGQALLNKRNQRSAPPPPDEANVS